MRLPPEPILVAAKRWLQILPTSGGVRRAQAVLSTHAAYADLTPTQYSAGLSLLRGTGLLNAGLPPPNLDLAIIAAILETSPPPWFQDADVLVRSPDELPSDILAVGEALGLEPSQVFDQVGRSWGKVDVAARERVGLAGEEQLVELLRASAVGEVDHIALRDDGYGYDVTVTTDEACLHLEVKSTTRSGRFTCYLSRHEHDVMLADPHWWLVTVRLSYAMQIEAVGVISRSWLAANVPCDRSIYGSWAAVKLEVPREQIGGLAGVLWSGTDFAWPSW